jgi:hypothetical protein
MGWPLCQREWLGTYCTGDWVGPTDGIDGSEVSLRLEFDHRTVQLIVSRYTDCDIPTWCGLDRGGLWTQHWNLNIFMKYGTLLRERLSATVEWLWTVSLLWEHYQLFEVWNCRKLYTSALWTTDSALWFSFVWSLFKSLNIKEKCFVSFDKKAPVTALNSKQTCTCFFSFPPFADDIFWF